MVEKVGSLEKANGRIWLGTKIKDSLTGLEGYCTSLAIDVTGIVRVGLQPSAKENNNLPEAWAIDENLVEYVGPGVVDKAYPLGIAEFNIGDIVKDTATAYQGTVNSVVYYVSGCVQYQIVGHVLNSKGEITHQVIPQQRLKLVSSAIKKENKTGTKPTGGPMTKIARM